METESALKKSWFNSYLDTGDQELITKIVQKERQKINKALDNCPLDLTALSAEAFYVMEYDYDYQKALKMLENVRTLIQNGQLTASPTILNYRYLKGEEVLTPLIGRLNNNIALCHFRLESYDKASLLLLENLENNDINNRTIGNYGSSLVELKRFDEAYEIIGDLINTNYASDMTSLHHYYARACKALGKDDEAKEYFMSAKKLLEHENPDNPAVQKISEHVKEGLKHYGLPLEANIMAPTDPDALPSIEHG